MDTFFKRTFFFFQMEIVMNFEKLFEMILYILI